MTRATLRADNSFGRAPHSHCGGRGFESHSVHQTLLLVGGRAHSADLTRQTEKGPGVMGAAPAREMSEQSGHRALVELPSPIRGREGAVEDPVDISDTRVDAS